MNTKNSLLLQQTERTILTNRVFLSLYLARDSFLKRADWRTNHLPCLSTKSMAVHAPPSAAQSAALSLKQSPSPLLPSLLLPLSRQQLHATRRCVAPRACRAPIVRWDSRQATPTAPLRQTAWRSSRETCPTRSRWPTESSVLGDTVVKSALSARSLRRNKIQNSK